MGCRHSSSPPESPIKNGGPVMLKSKVSIQRLHQTDHLMPNGGVKMSSTSRFSIPMKKPRFSLPPSLPITASSLEQTLDGQGKNLVKRFELDTACLLLDVSFTHILLLDGRQLRLINMETMNMDTCVFSPDASDIQEIVWSNQLAVFLLLTTDQLYQTGVEHLQPVPIPQIQFIAEGRRKSYMTADGDDLVINRSFGWDLRRYSLSKFELIQTPRTYLDNIHTCVTTIRLNSNKILALAVSIYEQQMIDLVKLNTNQLIYRLKLDLNENLLYPIDLHNNGQWFAKTCTPCVNIGHCLISSNGQITRLTLFPNHDNFIRSIRMSSDSRWLLVARQYALELYRPCASTFPMAKNLFDSI